MPSRVNIDDIALIRHIIIGINDWLKNKCLLYDFTILNGKNFFYNQKYIEHIPITIVVPSGNREIEWFHITLIPVLTKLFLDDPTE